MDVSRMTMKDWSAGQYLRFEAQRTRPAADLAAQIAGEAREIVDMGCGPGNSTELLVRRWPDARVSGFDSSPAMLEAARKRLPQCAFFQADVTNWTPSGTEDVIYANAVFQWVPDHLDVLEHLLKALKPGATLAIQVPDNNDEASHVAMREAAEDGPWREKLAEAAGVRDTIPPAGAYYDRLAPLSDHVDIWRTTFMHQMEGTPAIVEWFKSTGLRPFIDPLEPAEREAYLAAYLKRLEPHYPALHDGKVILPFPRVFVLAVRR
jgi:trans-aconitate 2-methyltransferase